MSNFCLHHPDVQELPPRRWSPTGLCPLGSKRRSLLLLLALVLGTVGCQGTGPSVSNADGKPQIVATHSVLCDLVQQLAAQRVSLTCLIQPGTDPHTYAPTPQDRRAIESADLILTNGYGLEQQLQPLIQAAPNSIPKIAVAEVAVPKPLMGEAHDHEEHGTEEHGTEEHGTEGHESPGTGEPSDSGSVPDPHVWHNAENGVAMVNVLTQELSKLDPEQAEAYRQQQGAIALQLNQIHTWIKAQTATIPPKQRILFTTHDALGYYAQTYGLRLEGTLQGLSTEQEPAAARIKTLVDEIRASGVPTLFPEQNNSSPVLQSVANSSGTQLSKLELASDGLGPPGSQTATYQTMLIQNTEIIVNGLGGKLQPFK
jgi:manganese/iron transport system substrate-binding protein